MTNEIGKVNPPIPKQTLIRLPEYLTYLRSEACSELKFISSSQVAKDLGRSEIQVRKDLAAVSVTPGKPKMGFCREALLRDIHGILGLNNVDSAVLVGVGNIGKALLRYAGFAGCGVKIVAAFDANNAKAGTVINGIEVEDISMLSESCKRHGARIGILALPAMAAQSAADVMVQAGILAIWNFAPVKLKLPENILIKDENLSASLTLLSGALAQRMEENA